MGLQLQTTSHSVNIKERLDFSCAVFEADGSLIANAPHIPVHLGSMGESVKSLIAARAEQLQPGDVYAMNNPFDGGTHLPDITVITPVFAADAEQGRRILFFVASRGHHADIGGITPGSMPANSTRLDQEGVVIDHFLLVHEGKFRERETTQLLNGGPYPARNPPQNIADLKAQVAANVRGAQSLLKLVSDYGFETVSAYMRFVRANAASAVREKIGALKNGSFSCAMDDGSSITVSVAVNAETQSAVVDFQGTSAQVASNLNAPRSICRAAVMYV
ncbi:MAG: hydantoinase B/oxoprolinase family protein, partial [Terriglobales bacterium]